jgi:hypothetical protein
MSSSMGRSFIAKTLKTLQSARVKVSRAADTAASLNDQTQ